MRLTALMSSRIQPVPVTPVLCCAAPCCPVVRCAVLCCAVLCCALMCHVCRYMTLRPATLRAVTPTQMHSQVGGSVCSRQLQIRGSRRSLFASGIPLVGFLHVNAIFRYVAALSCRAMPLWSCRTCLHSTDTLPKMCCQFCSHQRGSANWRWLACPGLCSIQGFAHMQHLKRCH
jgi:hypothetical protein